jgi:hypothetical protein
MDPSTLTATAITVAEPYVPALGKGAATAAGKSVRDRVKGRLTSETGEGAVKGLEPDPDDAANQRAVQAAPMKLFRAEPSALSEFAQLLDRADITSATLSAVVTGGRNNIGQIAGSSTVSNSHGKTT